MTPRELHLWREKPAKFVMTKPYKSCTKSYLMEFYFVVSLKGNHKKRSKRPTT